MTYPLSSGTRNFQYMGGMQPPTYPIAFSLSLFSVSLLIWHNKRSATLWNLLKQYNVYFPFPDTS